ncbi:lasso peptide biosynthesis B2 protein [Myxococcota bacterium]|nr:lasso peptide biosynthesis B2 protein [Myxococcota bacterium]
MLETPSPLRARLVEARIVTLRSVLPPLLEERSLDALLEALSAPGRRLWPAPEAELDAVERAVERWLEPGATLATTCLYRALVRYVLLRELGLDVAFVMGVRPSTSDDVVGHAWLELDGRVLRETLKEPYVVTFRYPARAS